MPDAVRESLKHVIMAEGGRSEKEAEEYMRTMDRRRRIQAETWS